ncbi:MAG: sigma-70 family RNA polymerase sigma factor [Planctomycetes bacterium]|nr:sigma-70 family RNA polymerase sigma factor [Planctomycetota bacterium]
MNKDALDNLAATCAQRAWRLARALCICDADADDAVQEAFVAAAAHRERIPGDDPWPWFAKVVTFKARDIWRKRASRKETAMPDDAAATVVNHDRNELAALVRDALAQLPQEQREALALTHLSGLTLAAAAEAADVPAGTVDSRCRKGLERLRGKLRASEAALLGCLPVLPINPPPTGYVVSTDRWLSAAKASAAGALVGAGGLAIMVKFGAGLVIGLILVVIAIFAFKLPLRFWEARGPATAVTSDGDADDVATPTTHTAHRPKPVEPQARGTSLPARDVSKEPALVKNAPVDIGNTAVADQFVVLKGRCLEWASINGKAAVTDRPIAGATVWLLERNDKGTHWVDAHGRLTPAASDGPAPSFRTTQAGTDGSFEFKDVPISLVGAVGMTHADYLCQTDRPPYWREGIDQQDEIALQNMWDDHNVNQWRDGNYANVSEIYADVVAEEYLAANQGTITLVATRGVSLHGTICGPEGQTIQADVTVTVNYSKEDRFSALAGHYEFPALRPGAVTLRVRAPGYATVERSIILSKDNQRLDFSLRRAGIIRLRFVPRAGRENVSSLVVKVESDLQEQGALRRLEFLAVVDAGAAGPQPVELWGHREFGLDEAGRLILDDIEAGHWYRFTVVDAEASGDNRLAVSERIFPTSEGVDVVLIEAEPVPVSVELAADAFASPEVKHYDVWIAPDEMFCGEMVSGMKKLGAVNFRFNPYPDGHFANERMDDLRFDAAVPVAETSYVAESVHFVRLTRENPRAEIRCSPLQKIRALAFPYKVSPDGKETRAGTISELLISKPVELKSGEACVAVADTRPKFGVIKARFKDVTLDGGIYLSTLFAGKQERVNVGCYVVDVAFIYKFMGPLWPGDYAVESVDINSKPRNDRQVVRVQAGETLEVILPTPAPVEPEEK